MLKTIKKTKLIFPIVLMAIFAIGSFAFAQVNVSPELGTTFGLGTRELYGTLIKVVNIALGFLGLIAISVILYGGFIWMTSGGIPEKVIKAKKILINGVIGVAIILLSFAIVQFVVRNIGGNGGVPTAPGGGSSGNGTLGASIIESVYPAPGQRDVVRNTSIIVTFKEEIDPTTIINNVTGGVDLDGDDKIEDWEDVNGNGLMDSGEYNTLVFTGLNPHVQIMKQSDYPGGPYITDVFATTTDNKTFVFKPVNLLGSSDKNIWYTTKLTGDIKKSDGTSALGVFGYFWSFEISTEVDVTPPYVTKVQPVAGGTYAKNVVMQINFSEAINPLSVNSNNIIINDSTSPPSVSGALSISNQYRTVEFLGNACGINSCNETIYCLPGNETIIATVKGATCDAPGGCPQAIPPFDGIVDMAFNSLDGNGNGVAEGVGDDYSWTFKTNNNIEQSAPSIESVNPSPGDLGVRLSDPIEVLFSEAMMYSSLNTNSLGISPPADYWITAENITGPPDKTRAYINHSRFNVATPYKTEVNSKVKDLYQNCLWPSEGPDGSGGMCGTDIANPYCCDGSPSNTVCP